MYIQNEVTYVKCSLLLVSSNGLATKLTTINPDATEGASCLRNYHGHSNYPGNGQQDIENVDSDIPAERKPAKPPGCVLVSRIISILGLCVVCVCGVGGG